MKAFFKKLWGARRSKPNSSSRRYRKLKRSLKRARLKIQRRIPKGARTTKTIDLKAIDLDSIGSYAPVIRWSLIVIALFLGAEMAGRFVGLLIKPEYGNGKTSLTTALPSRPKPTQDYGSILRRNIFDVERKIPEPFDAGQLDCFSQAKKSRAQVTLLGTIVMNDKTHSTALVQEAGNPVKVAVKKDDTFFDGKYQALEFERKKLCFLVTANQEYEYIEIQEENQVTVGTPTYGGGDTGMVKKLSDNQFQLKKSDLDRRLENITQDLTTARAVPYIRNGKFEGFLVQSMETDSIFRELGIKEGDVLKAVNGIQMDNPGKGLEAFQQLRNSPRIELEIVRGGQKTNLNYELQ